MPESRSAPSTPTSTTTIESSGGDSNRNTNNNRRNHRYNRSNRGVLNKAPEKKFEGRSDELKGHRYNFTNPKETANSFSTTTKETREYMGINYKMGNYNKRSINKTTIIALPNPTAPGATADKTDK